MRGCMDTGDDDIKTSLPHIATRPMQHGNQSVTTVLAGDACKNICH